MVCAPLFGVCPCPQGGTMPPGDGWLAGMLAAFQHTRSLWRLVAAAMHCLQQAGRPTQLSLHEAYTATLQLLQRRAEERPDLAVHCLAQPEGAVPHLTELLQGRSHVLGVAYRLIRQVLGNSCYAVRQAACSTGQQPACKS